MTNSLPWIMQGDNLVLVINGRQHTLNRETHPNYDRILEAIRNSDWDSIPDLVDVTRAVQAYANGLITVVDGDVYYDGRPFHNALADRLLEMLKQGFPVEPLCNFLGNLKDNPSKRAVDELYGFLEKNMLPITPDGHFLAYKRVRADFKDIHSGTMDNSVGQVVTMPRNEVDENAQNTCSSGLHFCSLDYLPHFGRSHGNNVVIVKINPRDVVSIPVDYNNAKGRACRYEVVGIHGAENADKVEAFDKVVVDDFQKPQGPASPREVRRDTFGYRFVDDGTFASRDAYDDWLDYLDDRNY